MAYIWHAIAYIHGKIIAYNFHCRDGLGGLSLYTLYTEMTGTKTAENRPHKYILCKK